MFECQTTRQMPPHSHRHSPIRQLVMLPHPIKLFTVCASPRYRLTSFVPYKMAAVPTPNQQHFLVLWRCFINRAHTHAFPKHPKPIRYCNQNTDLAVSQSNLPTEIPVIRILAARDPTLQIFRGIMLRDLVCQWGVERLPLYLRQPCG